MVFPCQLFHTTAPHSQSPFGNAITKMLDSRIRENDRLHDLLRGEA